MIEVSEQTMNRIHTILAGVEKADEKVLKPAMERGLTAGKKVFNKQIKDTYNITTTAISKHSEFKYNKVTMSEDGLIGSIEYSGFPIPLYKFKVSPSKPTFGKKQVNVSVKRGNMGTSKHAFVAQMQSGHLGVFNRTDKYSEKQRNQIKQTKHNQMIEERYGPSIPKMAGNAVVLESVEKRVNEVINQRIDHEIERLLNKY